MRRSAACVPGQGEAGSGQGVRAPRGRSIGREEASSGSGSACAAGPARGEEGAVLFPGGRPWERQAMRAVRRPRD
eukprot:13592234-Heterocapsa_arctica.AAC.1